MTQHMVNDESIRTPEDAAALLIARVIEQARKDISNNEGDGDGEIPAADFVALCVKLAAPLRERKTIRIC